MIDSLADQLTSKHFKFNWTIYGQWDWFYVCVSVCCMLCRMFQLHYNGFYESFFFFGPCSVFMQTWRAITSDIPSLVFQQNVFVAIYFWCYTIQSSRWWASRPSCWRCVHEHRSQCAEHRKQKLANKAKKCTLNENEISVKGIHT